jgi:putative spermidine/putrescine transport system ATP-binding protein
MAGVELRGLRRRFADVVALDGIDLDIASGEFVSFLGPSGCGKTTALRLVAGFDRPTAGRVLVDGKDITGTPPNRRGIGMVFQAYSLFPNMTAVRNVEFGLRVRKRGRGDRRKQALELLDLVGLADAANRYPHQLSGGMQQRVALARALAIEPRVLLLDEPLSALDAKVRVQLREEIRRIQTRLGITTIYVTHDQEEALSISDRVAVLSKGRIEQIGVPAEIYGAPSTPFVAQFVGTMNRIESTVSRDTPGSVDSNGVRLPVTAAQGRRAGERVLLLVRPETVELEAAGAPNGGLQGEVLSHTFLGAVTRVHVQAGESEWTADVSGERAAALPVGSRVSIRFPAESAKLLTLVEPLEELPDDQ